MSTTSNPLTDADRAIHTALGIDPAVLDLGGVRRVTDRQARDLGLVAPASRDLAGVVYPYLDPATGHRQTCRVRRDHPEIEDGRPKAKYLSGGGDRKHLYLSVVSAETLADTSIPVVMVEAEKSALMLRSLSDRTGRAFVPIATGGCWGWRGRIGKAAAPDGARVDEVGPVPDLDRVAWRDRPAILMADSNYTTNTQVRAGWRAFAAELTARGARVRIAAVPAEPNVNGPDDYRAAHDDVAVLRLLDVAVPVQPATVDDLLAECGALDLPTPCDASQAEPVIRALRDALRGADALRVSAARSKLVALLKSRKLRDAGRLADAAIGTTPDPVPDDAPFLADVVPWPESVDGAATLDEVVGVLLRYMVLPRHAADAIALWCAHAYLMAEWSTSAILAVLSPVKRCGKSTLMELVQALVPRGLLVSNLSTSSLFRAIETFKPCLLSDEADTWLSDDTSELRGIFNSGWRRGTAKVLRCEGDEHTPTIFSTWAAKAIAAIGKLPGTVEDRSIVVSLRRRTATEPIERFRQDRVEAEALPLRRHLQRWADDHAADLAQLDPDDLPDLNDRASDNWRPLRMLAEALGADWPARADAAALALSGVTIEADDNIGVQLLGDVYAILKDRDQDVIPSSGLVAALVALEERPWSEWSHGKPLNPHKLARLLKPFGIIPIDTRSAGKVLKSYRRAAFAEPWERYLPQDSGFKAQHRNTPNESGPESPILKAQQAEPCCALKSEETSMNPGLCCDVALSNPTNGPADMLSVVFDED